MPNTILKASNISKQYRLGLVGTGTLSHDLNRWWHRVRGKEDPYLKVGAVNDRSQSAKENYVWALKDINFDVKQGEVLGIIGKNGAGKSTLLKLLSRVTLPTTGKIKTKGRIASLLEVGTGFHPELTGRENIFLNGAILGMTKTEIKSKEQEIIDFSGCEMYIDTPVKRYSSGMRVRLAFAVAAHLEPDILVIDEVLAVGDAEFQKKALGKMKDISGTGGRTVLFVSHNMAAVKSLCTRAMVLENGKVVYSDSARKSVDYYLSKHKEIKQKKLIHRTDRTGSGKLRLLDIKFFNKKDNEIDSVLSGDFLKIKFFYRTIEHITANLIFAISFKDNNEVVKSMVVSDELGENMNSIIQKGYITVEFEKFLLRGSLYNITVLIAENSTRESDHIDRIDNATDINVLQGDFYSVGKPNRLKPTSIMPCKIY